MASTAATFSGSAVSTPLRRSASSVSGGIICGGLGGLPACSPMGEGLGVFPCVPSFLGEAASSETLSVHLPCECALGMNHVNPELTPIFGEGAQIRTLKRRTHERFGARIETECISLQVRAQCVSRV